MNELRRFPNRWRDRWHRLDVAVRDLPLALTLTGAAFVPVLREHGTQVGEVPARPNAIAEDLLDWVSRR